MITIAQIGRGFGPLTGGGGAIPAAPGLAVTDAGSGTATATVTGSGTIQLYYRLPTASTWTTGNSRSGSGTISQTGLTEGSIYDFYATDTVAGMTSGPSAIVREYFARADTNCILEQIAQYLYALVALVTQAEGYSENLTALRPKRVHFWDELTSDKTVLITQGSPTITDQSHATIDWEQPFSLQVILIDSDAATASIETRLNNIRSDIEKKLREDITLNNLAYNLEIKPCDYYSGDTFTGIGVNIAVSYRTSINNPYVAA